MLSAKAAAPCCYCSLDSFVTPWAVDQQVPLSMGSPRQEHWRGLPFPSPGDLLNPGIKLESPALVSRFFTPEPLGKPHHTLGEHSFPESEAGLHISVVISPPSPKGVVQIQGKATFMLSPSQAPPG